MGRASPPLSRAPAAPIVCLATAGLEPRLNVEAHAIRWLGVVLAALALWPMARALDALSIRDYLGGILLLALAYLPARTGVELVTLAGAAQPGGRPS